MYLDLLYGDDEGEQPFRALNWDGVVRGKYTPRLFPVDPLDPQRKEDWTLFLDVIPDEEDSTPASIVAT